MITGMSSQNPAAQPAVLFNSRNTEVEKQQQALQKQAEKLREATRNGVDTAEISDEARAMSAAAREKAASAGPLGTRENRAETAKDYNRILADLREEYGEKEAMRRFDKIMRDDGYELVTEENGHGIGPDAGFGNPAARFDGGFWAGDGDIPPLGIGKDRSGSNLQTHSYIRADIADGEVRYLADTYANYAANLGQDVYDALAGVYQKNLESAQGTASFDLGAYMKDNFGNNPQTSAVSASAELGTIAAALLKEAGVELGGNDKVSFSLKEDGSGLFISGNVADTAAAQEAVDAALQRNPDMLQAFKNEYNRVAMTDTAGLGGAYSDGARSVGYTGVSRSFTYSAKEPSAVVMTDTVGVSGAGFNYQKKVSDSFDVNADMTTVIGGGYSIGNPDYDHMAVNRELEERVSRAMESGELIDSTMTSAEYEAGKAERMANFEIGRGLGEAKLYYSGDAARQEQEKAAAEARQALRDLDADPNLREREISYADEQRQARKATAAQLLELFTLRRETPGLEMITSIMESLRGLAGK